MSFEVTNENIKGHITGNPSRDGLQVLHDGFGVLVGLCLATEVASEGLKQVLVVLDVSLENLSQRRTLPSARVSKVAF